jgi:hypothetical protein
MQCDIHIIYTYLNDVHRSHGREHRAGDSANGASGGNGGDDVEGRQEQGAGTIYLNVFSAEPSLTNYLPSSKPAHCDETDWSFLKQPTSVHSTNEHTWKVPSGTLRQKLDVFCLQTAPSP